MLGVMAPYEALKEAQRRGLDLVEISPKANPPVCKIMDFGKYKYEQKKKTHGQKKTPAGNIIKEVSLSPQTDTHDLGFKMRNCMRFLEEGHRVKVMVRFRGREMAHPEIGQAQMLRVIDSLKDVGVTEGNPKMEGKLLMALFVPLHHGGAKAKTPKPSELGKVLGDSSGKSSGKSSGQSSGGGLKNQMKIPSSGASPRAQK